LNAFVRFQTTAFSFDALITLRIWLTSGVSSNGRTETVPIYSEINVDDYKQKTPLAIPGAQIAWTMPYTGTDQSAIAYSMQWNNPRPEVEIQSIDLVYGEQRRGVPALLAITAATAR
jgi:beta-galactosidase